MASAQWVYHPEYPYPEQYESDHCDNSQRILLSAYGYQPTEMTLIEYNHSSFALSQQKVLQCRVKLQSHQLNFV